MLQKSQFFSLVRFTPVQLLRIHVASFIGSVWKCPPTIDRFVFFIGHQRSGTSLVGSLIDAHPQAMIAHEEDAIRFHQALLTRRQLFYVLIRNSKWKAATGRSEVGIHGGHTYAIDTKYQGSFDLLKVLGDKYAPSTARLFMNENLLESFCKKIVVPITVFHVIRNPLDTIGSNYRHGLKGRYRHRQSADVFDQVLQGYDQRQSELEWCYRVLPKYDIRIEEIYLEDLITNTIEYIGRMFSSLCLGTNSQTITELSRIVASAPTLSRVDLPHPISESEKKIAMLTKSQRWLSRYWVDAP